MTRHLLLLVAALFVALLPAAAGAAVTERPVLILVDISGSMADDDGTGRIKMDGAKAALLSFIRNIDRDVPVGLRTYPDPHGGQCNGGTVQSPIVAGSPQRLASLVRNLEPDGNTPTAEALLAAEEQLLNSPYREVGATIVLVSDGESNCAPPCETAAEIRARGVDIEAITVGFQLQNDRAREELECIADATGGSSLNVEDGDELQETLDRIARAGLEVGLDYPAEVTADVGNTASGAVRVRATVRNTGGRLGQNVTARLRFDLNSAPGLSRPVVSVGNLAPGDERAVEWTFRADSLLVDDLNPNAGTAIRFTVIARADGALADAEERGEVRVVNRFTKAQAGPLLSGIDAPVIMGDSYSAGEGARPYLHHTDNERNSCHHSRRTYAFIQMGMDVDDIIACSGAVTADITRPNEGNNVDSQVAQLQRRQIARGNRVPAVLLTLGGNDAGFPALAKSCLFAFRACNENVVPNLVTPWSWLGTDDFVDQRMDGLPSRLESAYQSIHGVLNSEDAIRARGGAAPIFVLAYPLPLGHRRSRACTVERLMFTADEVNTMLAFGVKLNAAVEQATLQARQRGIPAFFVWNVEEAFLPDHTVCHERSFLRSVQSLRTAEIDIEATMERFAAAAAPGAVVTPVPVRVGALAAASTATLWETFTRGAAEVLHPNENGYRAMTHALFRWSGGSPGEAAEAQEFLATVTSGVRPRFDVDPVTGGIILGQGDLKEVAQAGVDTGQLVQTSDPFDVRPGASYPLRVDGFAAGGRLSVVVNSTPRDLGDRPADADGVLDTLLHVPEDLEPGSHTLVISGLTPEGVPREVRVPIDVPSGWLPSWPVLLASVAAFLVLLGSGLIALALPTAFGVRWRRDSRSGISGD